MTGPNPQEGGKEQGFLPESPSADAGPFPRSPWHPISTAPKDGTCVDLWVEIVEEAPNSFYLENEAHRVASTYYSDYRWLGGEWPFVPTHWMPLPEPPATGDRASSRDEGGLRDEPETPTLQATGGENGR